MVRRVAQPALGKRVRFFRRGGEEESGRSIDDSEKFVFEDG